eukprot:Amastigsp_a174496_138.p5 type:complete len:101 gc:universal Amastigsp_a174496_138:668-970(+)
MPKRSLRSPTTNVWCRYTPTSGTCTRNEKIDTRGSSGEPRMTMRGFVRNLARARVMNLCSRASIWRVPTASLSLNARPQRTMPMMFGVPPSSRDSRSLRY